MQAAGSGGAILRPAPLQARGSLLSILSVQLRLRHQPSSTGSCDGAVMWGERAAVGPQSVIAPLNHVLSLSPCFASCCLQSLGTLSPYSQVMPPGGVCHLLLPQGVPLPRDHWGFAEHLPAQGGGGGGPCPGGSFGPWGEQYASAPWQSGPREQLLPHGGEHQ